VANTKRKDTHICQKHVAKSQELYTLEKYKQLRKETTVNIIFFFIKLMQLLAYVYQIQKFLEVLFPELFATLYYEIQGMELRQFTGGIKLVSPTRAPGASVY